MVAFRSVLPGSHHRHHYNPVCAGSDPALLLGVDDSTLWRKRKRFAADPSGATEGADSANSLQFVRRP
jgi:hypothetical protein